MSDRLVDLTLEEAAEALNAIPSPGKGERVLWTNMAKALKSEFGDQAFGCWDDWSSRGGGYDAKTARTVWDSFKGAKGRPVTIGSLIAEARRCGYEFKPQELTKEEKARRKREAEARRAALIEQQEKDEATRDAWRERLAVFCQDLAGRLSLSGSSPYLDKKRVRSFGLLFVEQAMVMVTWIAQEHIELITKRDEVKAFFDQLKSGEIDREAISFRHLKRGTVAVPMRDEFGKLWNLQFIFPSGKKSFPKFGRKAGLFHLLTEIEGEPDLLAIAEGYATGASARHAKGWPVAVAFDAGNLNAVGQAMRKRHPGAFLMFLGDDDRATEGNPGRKAAEAAAAACEGMAVFPQFKKEEAPAT